MPIINNPFNGKLNLDVADYRLSNGDYKDALNVTKDAQGKGQDKVVSNILGNINIPYTLPSGTNKVIGFYPDKIRNRAYYFLWNSNGYNSILYYDSNAEVVVRVLESKTNSSGIDILNFNPSYKVVSVNIFYRDDEGDLLFFNDGLNPPKVINVNADYGNLWKYEYLLVIKAPPVMPPKVVYENDTTVKINNLRNKLFQFSYRYVYDNNEKSVWSSKSIVPLPQQPTLTLTDDTYTNNSRISISITTGGANVMALEISFRETTNGNTSDWFLIKSFKKEDEGIIDNDIFTYKFKNDGIYTQIDVLEADQLQDFVPQKANAAELANGNVLLYSGITEGYDKTDMNTTSAVQNLSSNFYCDYNGLLFFATSNGDFSTGKTNTILKIYLYGTGTNSSDIISTLNNSAAVYVINAKNGLGVDIGISYTNTTQSTSVSTLLAAISTALQANGWTQSSLVNNVLTMKYSAGFILASSGLKYYSSSIDNTLFANAWDSGYEYAVQYFDNEGRTIGAQNSIFASFNTPSDNGNRFCQPYLQISNKPPLEAAYYQVLRSNNTTYNKRLYWISECAYQGPVSGQVYYYQGTTTTTTTTLPSTGAFNYYVYIGLNNIDEYNKQISSTQNVVSYNYTEGDRIKFLARYDAEGTKYSLLSNNLDYEVLGTESIITTAYGTQISGRFIKIRYPYGDISANFNFNNGFEPTIGTENFIHYEILLYNYTDNTSNEQRFFYEFGKQYGIGNAGTANAYHLGDIIQTSSTPAYIYATSGDLFYRKRNVVFNDYYKFNVISARSTTLGYYSIPIAIPGTLANLLYAFNSEGFAQKDLLSSPGTPVYTDSDWFFWNKSATETLTVRVSINYNVTNSRNPDFTSETLAIVCPSAGVRYSVKLGYSGDQIESTFKLTPNSKLWFVYEGGFDNTDFGSFDFNFYVVKNKEIKIIEQSFNDTYNLVTNSNGRVSVIEENAKQTYFPTLIRFGGAYQIDTNINQINNFKYENFDEYDRSFGDVIRLHVRDRYLKVYQKFKVGNVPILTQIVKDSANNPLQANTDTLINKIQYYAGDYGIGDAATSLAWNNFADYFVDNYRGVVCRLSQDGITPISITNSVNAFFTATLPAYRQDLNNGIGSGGTFSSYTGNPCIYGVFDAYTNKYIIAMEEINRYSDCTFNGGSAIIYIAPTTTSTTAAPTTTTTTSAGTTTTTTTTASLCTTWTGTAVGSGFFYWTPCGTSKLLKFYYTAGQTLNFCASYVTGIDQNDFEGSGLINTGSACV